MKYKPYKSLRLPDYDYSLPGLYYVTICTKNSDYKNRESSARRDMVEYFGKVKNEKMMLNQSGKIVEEQWLWLKSQYGYVDLDEFIVMPNHFHGVLSIKNVNEDYENSEVAGREDFEILKHENFEVAGREDFEILKHENFEVAGREDFEIFKHENSEVAGRDPRVRNFHQKIKPLSELIGAFKTTSSKKIHLNGLSDFQWQRSFYDHVVRDEDDLSRIRYYIKNNPKNWHYKNNKQNNFE